MNRQEAERLLYLEALILVHGSFGRADLMSKFGISAVTASRTIGDYQKLFPDQIRLDKRPVRPIFIPTEGTQPRLFETAQEATDFLNHSEVITKYIQRIALILGDEILPKE